MRILHKSWPQRLPQINDGKNGHQDSAADDDKRMVLKKVNHCSTLSAYLTDCLLEGGTNGSEEGNEVNVFAAIRVF